MSNTLFALFKHEKFPDCCGSKTNYQLTFVGIYDDEKVPCQYSHAHLDRDNVNYVTIPITTNSTSNILLWDVDV